MLRFVSLTLLFLTVVSSTARADMIVAIQNTMITAGGSGFVDVLISSTGTDTLDFASYDFQISLVGGPASTLQFSNPQNLTETGLANYVFAGDAGAINVITLTNSQFTADAGTLSFAGVGLTAATSLLARLEVESVLGPGQTAAQANGEQFRISLLNSFDTLLKDENGNDLTIDGSSFTIPNTGLITIQAAAVPEPSSLGLCAIGAAVMGWRMRRQRTKTHSSEPIMAGEPGDQMG